MDVFGEYSTTICLAAIAAGLFIAQYIWRYLTLQQCGLKGPRPWPVVGNFIQMRSMGLLATDKLLLKKYGKICGFYNGARLTVHISDLDLLKDILVKDFPLFMDRPMLSSMPRLLTNALFFMLGGKWKQTRNIMTPAFSSGKLKRLFPIVNNCARQLSKNLEQHIDETRNISGLLGAFSIDTIASTAFGMDINSQHQPDDPFVKNVQKIFQPRSVLAYIPVFMSLLFPWLTKQLARLGLLSTFPTDAVDFYDDVGKAIIEERKKGKQDRYDFLKLLMEAELDSSKSAYLHNDTGMADHNGHTKHNVSRLSDEEVNSQVFLFFLAGFETTSSLLRYATYRLAIDPEADRRMMAEIREHIGDDEATHEGIAKLKYMEMFIYETLRFYPPIPRLTRVASKSYTHGDVTIPKGASVQVPVYMVQHDPDNYPNPEVFDPERFSPERKDAVNQYAFLSFGVGPRHCIGMRLALMEAKVALLYMLRKVKFVRSEKTEVPLALERQALLRPVRPIQLTVEARK